MKNEASLEKNFKIRRTLENEYFWEYSQNGFLYFPMIEKIFETQKLLTLNPKFSIVFEGRPSTTVLLKVRTNLFLFLFYFLINLNILLRKTLPNKL